MAKTKKTVQEGIDTEQVSVPPVEETKVEKEDTTKNTVVKTVNKKAKVAKSKKPELKDDEEINVVSLVANVSYWDKSTDETYKWVEIGEVIPMTFAVIKNMWRNYKNYFRNFYLKPLDERVVDKLGLKKTYEKFEFLTDGSQYTKANLDKILSAIDGSNNAFKSAICNNIKSMINDGEITNVSIIMALGKKFDVDFISLLD